jgi:hypothetical protein
VRTLVLVPHVVAGCIGLVIGPFAILRVRRTTAQARLELAYQLAVGGLCATAIGLTFYEPGLWWLALVAVATAVAARAGWVLARRRPPGWRSRHLKLVGGSYIAFVTGFLVVATGWVVAWLLPSAIGIPIIHVLIHRQGHGGQPPRRSVSSHRRPSASQAAP